MTQIAITVPITDVTNEAAVATEVGVDESQFCRTCTHGGNRLWQHSVVEIIRHEKSGGTADDLKCRPDESTQLIRLGAEGRIKDTSPEPAQSLVETCGHKVLDKCIGCSRLVRQEVSVEGGRNASGKAWRRQILVGGYCSIGAEGIERNGKIVHCDRKPMPMREPERNCFTCGNATVFGNVAMNDHGTPVQIDLTPYQMEQVRRAAPPDEIGLAIWQARQRLGQIRYNNGKTTGWVTPGMIKFFEADVVEWITDGGSEEMIRGAEFETVGVYEQRQTTMMADWLSWGRYVMPHPWLFIQRWTPHTYNVRVGSRQQLKVAPVYATTPPKEVAVKVRFRGSGSVGIFSLHSAEDTEGIVYRSPNPAKVIIQFTSPRHRDFGLPEVDMVAKRAFGLSLPPRQMVGADLSHLVDGFCPRCEPHRPCYWHAKAPRIIETAEGTDVIYRRPEGRDTMTDVAPARHLIVSAEGRVTDANGEPPEPMLFRLRMRDFMFHPQAKAIRKQYFEMVRGLKKLRPRATNLAFGRFLSVEPWKPYCSLNMANPQEGLDLRELFGDWFGDPRGVMGTNPLYDRRPPLRASDSYYSWSKHMELEDWQRVTNPAERYTEELVRNDHIMKTKRQGQAITPFVMPEQTNVEQLPILGDIDSTTAFVDWLDEKVPTPISETGEEALMSHRWHRYGYEQFRGFTQKAGSDLPEVVVMNTTIDHAETDAQVGFFCSAPSCGAQYSVDEVNDPENPTCIRIVEQNDELDVVRECGAPLSWFERDPEWEQGHLKVTGTPDPEEPYRRLGSPTLAGGPNSRRWLQDERLLRVGCDSWRPKPWVKRRYAAPKTNAAAAEAGPDTATLVGKELDVLIEDEELHFTIGHDIKCEAPLIQAIAQSHGNDTLEYEGGHGVAVTARILALR